MDSASIKNQTDDYEISEFKSPKTYKTNKNSSSRWIISHVLRHKKWFIPVIFLQFLAAFLTGLVPILIGFIIGLFESGELTTDLLFLISIFIIIAGGGASFINLVRGWFIEVTAQRLERDTRDELYSSLIGKSLTFHDGQTIGDVMARASTDVRQLNLMINPGFSLVFSSALGIIMPFIFIAFIDLQLLFIPILFLISYIITLRWYNRKLGYVSYQQRVINGNINSRLNETISGMYLVRGMAQENKEQVIFDKNIADFKQNVIAQGSIQARYYPLLFLGIAIVFSLYHAIILKNQGVISFGETIAFLGLVQLLRFPTFINIFAFTMLTLGVASAERVLQLINSKTEIDSNPSGHNSTIQGIIQFQDVTFGYNPDKPVIKNANFIVQPGQTVAIVGMTGSGKTTITKLLSRLYDPQIGRIYIDNVDLKDWSINALRSQMALVEQDIFLFSKSIRDNIKFGVQNANNEEIQNAAKLAQAHSFIMDLPDGYETIIGERGAKLSGGQRQRVAIARAVLRNPRILFLDDASSAIDSKTEDEIQVAIKSVLQGRVSFLITHRLAQIRRADLIILLDKGKIIDQGTHERLITSCPTYIEIFSAFDDFEEHYQVPTSVSEEV